MTDFDLVIIGAGPAGMSAAAQAAKQKITVLLLDEQVSPGGQIYRGVDLVTEQRANILGKDYLDGEKLTHTINHHLITYIKCSSVWQIEVNGKVAFTVDGQGRRVSGKRILIASGALERPMPIPGWTLPGVMTAGAGQILLKQSGVVASGAVLAGCGPLMYLLAAQMIRAGAPPIALVETQSLIDFFKALRHLKGALIGWRYLLKGLSLIREIQSAKIPRYKAATNLICFGNEHLESVRFHCNGKTHEIKTHTLLLHHGVVPNIHATQSLRLDHQWDHQQQCFKPTVDSWGETENSKIFVAGDGAGIGGAVLAAISGNLVGLKVARELNQINDEVLTKLANPFLILRKKELAARPFIDAAYPPFSEAQRPTNDTIVCRCEEVKAGDVRRYASLGCLGPNQTKAFGRVGMGPCQGRYCGLTVSHILSECNQISMQDTGFYRIRPPLKPITLGELSLLEPDDDDLIELEH
jgi:thioredoxin reductase